MSENGKCYLLKGLLIGGLVDVVIEILFVLRSELEEKVLMVLAAAGETTKLTDIEFILIKTHSQSRYNILKDIDFPSPVARMVLEHHERMNGSGYPNGLTGDNVLMESRILSVADVVESVASHRPYRPTLGIKAALAEIEKNKGTLYDNTVADAGLKLFRDKDFQFGAT
jgi:HD-GYP domain-containing protein (c-di-GMP phosphodiesterase class II)